MQSELDHHRVITICDAPGPVGFNPPWIPANAGLTILGGDDSVVGL